MSTDAPVQVHPTAVVDSRAQLGEGVEVGPYAVIGEHVSIGTGTRVRAHAVIGGRTEIGEHCDVYPGAVIGLKTQDLKYRGGAARVRIGNRNVIREHVTINSATEDGDETRVGDDNLIMAYVHIAHDCSIGDGVVIANAVTMGGHVTIESRAVVGGMVGIHQFVRIGELSISGGCSKLVKDLPPFMIADGNPVKIYGINRVGLERAGVPVRSRDALKQAYRLLYRSKLTVADALVRIEAGVPSTPEVGRLVRFVRESDRGISR